MDEFFTIIYRKIIMNIVAGGIMIYMKTKHVSVRKQKGLNRPCATTRLLKLLLR